MVKIAENISENNETAAPPNLYIRNAYNQESFGGKVGEGLGKWAQYEFQLAQQKQDNAANTDVLKAYNEASREKSKLLYDPDNGLYTRQGENVGNAVDDFSQRNREIGENASKGLSSEAKAKFDAMWLRSEGPDLEGVMKHEFAERQKYKAATGNATIDLAVNNAINGYGNPDIISRSKTEVLGAVMQAMPGASKTAIADKVLEGYSNIHKGVILKLGAESPAKAEQYFKENASEMTAADNVQVTNILRGQIFKSKVLQDAEKITATNGPVRVLYDTLRTTNPQGAALMEAVTDQESDFRPNIETKNKDSAGNVIPEKTAVGLTQVLVSTAREISEEAGDGLMKGKSTEEVKQLLKDPATNLRYGMFYLQKALKKYGGDLEASLIAYNAGPGNADKWLRANRDYSVLPDRAQTEPYVRNVLGMYRRNLGNTKYAETAANMDTAGVRPTATDGQLSNFRDHFPAEKIGQLNMSVEHGAAQMWEAMPEPVREAMKATAAGGDLLVDTRDPFAKEWILDAAPHFGVAATEGEGGSLTISSGKGPTDISPMVSTQDYDLDVWLEQASKIEDPARRDAVERELMQRHAALQKARKQDENGLKSQAWEMVLDGKDVPVELQKKLTPEYMATLNEYKRKIASSGKIETDWATWVDLRTKSDEDLANLGDVMQYRTKLADAEFKTLVDMVKGVRGHGDPAKKGLAGDVRTRTQMVQNTVDRYFPKNAAFEGKLNSVLDSQIESFWNTHKKAPNSVEMQTMIDQLVMKADVNSQYADQYMFEVKPGETIEKPLVTDNQDIPQVNRASAIQNAPQIFGRQLTPDELAWTYTAAIANTRGAYVRTPEALRTHLINAGVSPNQVDKAYGWAAMQLMGIK